MALEPHGMRDTGRKIGEKRKSAVKQCHRTATISLPIKALHYVTRATASCSAGSLTCLWVFKPRIFLRFRAGDRLTSPPARTITEMAISRIAPLGWDGTPAVQPRPTSGIRGYH